MRCKVCSKLKKIDRIGRVRGKGCCGVLQNVQGGSALRRQNDMGGIHHGRLWSDLGGRGTCRKGGPRCL